MPKLPDNSVPSYRLHKQSGQAIVTLSGRDILLGPHGTPASRAEYRRQIAEWIANGRQVNEQTSGFTITEMIAAFKVHAERYYRSPEGEPTSEIGSFRSALRPLRLLYGPTPASEFGPLALEAIRNEMIRLSWRKAHRWHPHQLRHTAGTDIRRQFGSEAAQHVLGHASMNTTEIYAEKNAELASRVAAAIG